MTQRRGLENSEVLETAKKAIRIPNGTKNMLASSLLTLSLALRPLQLRWAFCEAQLQPSLDQHNQGGALVFRIHIHQFRAKHLLKTIEEQEK